MKSGNAGRSRSRRFLVQALYQSRMTGEAVSDVIEPFIAYHNMKRADLDYFREVMRGINDERSVLRDVISHPIDRDYDELDPIESAILLLGVYELLHRIEVPYRVVINEGVELAKLFGASESYKYVNSILDNVAQEYRTIEMK